MRQIELHRVDPNVTLKPPLHPIARWLRKYGVYLFFLIYDTYRLITLLGRQGPATRVEVFNIVLASMGIGTMIFVCLALNVLDDVWKISDKRYEVTERLIDIVAEIKDSQPPQQK